MQCGEMYREYHRHTSSAEIYLIFTATFNKILHVSLFSPTGDGGPLTEVTDGDPRMNCDT